MSYTVVHIQERIGLVRADTQQFSHELFHDGKFIGMYESKKQAEEASQMLIYGKVIR